MLASYRQATTVCPRSIILLWNRTYSKESEDYEGNTLLRRIVLRKQFSELPKTHLLPDGSRAVPLEDWHGGLAQSPNTRVSDQGSVKAARRRRTLTSQQNNVGTAKRERVSQVSHIETDTVSQEYAYVEGVQADSMSTPRTSSRRRKQVVHTEDDIPTPRNQLAVEILENLDKFPHCILFTRVGQFYESYFDQANEVAALLSIKLTSRKWDKKRIPMCGFPIAHLDKYLKVLVQQHNRFVAMCEEFPRSGDEAGFERRVVRVITPGTLIDESFLNSYENNFLLAVRGVSGATGGTAVTNEREEVGLAWIDVSTGEFFTERTTLSGLRDEIARICPKEIVLDKELESLVTHPIKDALTEQDALISYLLTDGESSRDLSLTENLDKLPMVSDLLSSPRTTHSPHETSAIELLTSYLQSNLLESMPRLGLTTTPSLEADEGRMQIDAHTIRALEIRESEREGGIKGSLLSIVKRTVTSGGTRLLGRWLCSPSTSLNVINARQSLVTLFCKRIHFRDDIIQSLHDAEDVTRIIQKFTLGRGDASDLLALSDAIRIWESMKGRMTQEKKMEFAEVGRVEAEDWASLDSLLERMGSFEGLSQRIFLALHGTQLPPSAERAENEAVEVSALEDETENEGTVQGATSATTWKYDYGRCTIKPEFSEKLASLHVTLKDLLDQREELEAKLQRSFAAPSLTLRSSPGQGMHVHIQRAKRDQSKLRTSPLFIGISESGTTKSYFYQPWAQLGGQITETASAISVVEREAFETLRNEVIRYSLDLRRTARILDELDIATAFAKLATELNFVKPTLTEDTTFNVVDGRHPTVELALLASSRVFTPNTISMSPESRLHILTGPNMAGKSTFLRQTALIAILAQVGSYVPADDATIGVVDKLFSRIGARDDLFRDRSTFMVEMLETSEILRKATPRSLVIMDEVGRGTTVKDGLAIAFAAVHHLVSVNQCRALFATHFHEISDMLGCSLDFKGEGAFSNVEFYCTDVDDTEDGHFAYSHRVRPGVNRDSHGLKVAQISGMPQSAVAVARGALDWLKSNSRETERANAGLFKSLGQTLARRAETRSIALE